MGTYYSTDIEPNRNIFESITRERIFQDQKYGDLSTRQYSVLEWICIMDKELSEAKEWFFGQNASRGEMLKEILQVVAVGVACLEQHGVIEREEILHYELFDIESHCPHRDIGWDGEEEFDSCHKNGRGYGKYAECCFPKLECAAELNNKVAIRAREERNEYKLRLKAKK